MTSTTNLKDQIQDILPLSPLQRGVLFHTLFAPGSPVYFEQLICRLDGAVDPAAMADALERLAERHPILRTAFVTKGQAEPRQVVFRRARAPLAVHDWSQDDAAGRERRLEALLDEDRRRGFQLNRPPLMRLTLLRYGPEEWRLIWSHHHILLDGWSLPILMRDYFALLSGAALPPPPPPFAAYLGWLGRQDQDAAAGRWRALLGDVAAPTPLGLDRPALPGALAGADVGQIEMRLDYRADGDLAAAAERCQVTPGSLLLGAWAILLSRYSRQDDVVFGLTLSGRAIDLPGVDGMAGLLINSLPLRLPVPADAALPQWLTEVQRRQLELQSLSHSDLAEVQRHSGVPRGQPLFETLVAIDNFPIGDTLPSDGLGFRISDVSQRERTHYPLTLTLVPGADGLSLKLGFDRARVDEAPAAALAEAYLELLRQIAARPDAALRELGLVRPSAIQPAVPADCGGPDTLAAAFLAAAERFPDRVAVSDGSATLSYRQLRAQAAAIAERLRRDGVAPGVRVGVCLPRSAGQIAAMLGVTLAGGVYLPLDPDYPAERLAYQLADSQALLTLTDAELRPRLPAEHPCLSLTEIGCGARPAARPPAELDAEHGAYVIYTSGSTGQPKGVLVSHRNVLRLFSASARHFAFDENDVWSYFHSFAFDFSVWEIWGALLHGGRCVVVPRELSRDPAAFVELLGREGVTVLNQTPSAFKLAIAAEGEAPLPRPSALRWVIFGGEALRLAELRPWLERHGDDGPRLANMYGITETTVHVTFRRILAADLDAGGELSPIGEPLDDLSLELADPCGHPVPLGAPGEILVGGAGVSLGYLNRPQLNAERFPGVGAQRRYRSGDLARRNADGELLYCGRIDQQVKIRGFRIELGEVRAALLSHPAVRDVHLVAADEQLIAYLRADDPAAAGAEALRRHLAARLPAHMIPAVFIALAEFPLTLNGKVDARALPSPQGARSALDTPYVEASTPRQKLLAEIWSQVLALPRVGVHDNYFSLGGDSIRSVRIAGLAKERGCPLSIQDIFRHGTIAAIVEAMGEDGDAAAPDAELPPFALIDAADRALLPPEVEDALPLARLQAGMLFHNEYDDGRNLYHDVFSHRLRADISPERLRQALAELSREHPLLRTGFALAGYSQPLQLVWRDLTPSLEIDDLRGLSPQQREDAVASQVRQLSEQRFAPERPPLLRVGCLRLADDEWQLTLAIHHAILDGWSVATLCTRLFERMRGQTAAPVRQSAFRDFVAAERAALADPAQQAYWRAQLSGLPSAAVPRWPQRAAPTGKARVGARETRLPAALAAALIRQAADCGLPLKTLLLAVHARALACLCGQDEIVTGLVSNGRPADADGAEALGLFLNTLPLRVRVAGSWRALLAETMATEGASLPHRFFPMAEIFKLGEAARFDTSFNYVDFHIYRRLDDGGGLEVLDTRSQESVDIPLAVTFSASRAEGSVALGFSYDRAAFPDEQVAAIGRLYLAAAAALARDPDAPCLDAALADRSETAAQPLSGPSAGLAAFSVPQAVAAVARQRPDAVAVAGDGATLSYAQLDGQANRLARQLLARGVGPDAVVALDLPRSPELVAAMLATLKAGAAYLPLDRGQPEARRREILDEAAPALLLSLDPAAYAPPGCAVLQPDLAAELNDEDAAAPAAPAHGDALAYLLFTSGSSGRPKGVAVGRAALDNHMAWMNRRYPLDADDTVLQKTPVGFDASVWEFWAPLTQGARLLLAAENGHRDPDYLIRAVREQGVTVLQLVPSLLAVLLSTPDFAGCRSLRRVFVGGEALPAATLARFHAALDIPLVNLYGPTETAIDASSAEYLRADAPAAAVGIGRPIDGAAFRVLDARLNPVPPGVRGELYIAGCGLARGYLDQPAQTARRFLPDPQSPLPGGRMYRSGDIVRLLPGGVLEYLGRADGQVKLRGQRLELDEVEAGLAACPGVRQAAAALYRDRSGADRLAGYVGLTPEAEAGDWQAAILAALRLRLPEYMLPARLIALRQWPVNANGKTDRAALPAPQTDEAAPTRGRAPDTPQERTLAAIWRQVLGRDDIGADDNFFQLGGDSILGLQIVAQARQAGLALAARDIFSHPSIAELAAQVRPARQEAALAEIPPGAPLPLTPAQRWFFDRIETLPRPGHWNQALLLSVAAGVSAPTLRRALLRLEQNHDAFRLRFAADADGWRQRYAPREALREEDWLERVDLSALPATERAAAVEARAEAAQRALDLEHGPLLRAVHFDYGDGQAGRLLLVIHHLIVDGVSWRVLLQDLAGLLAGAEAAPVRVGFGHWALRPRAPSAEARAYWLDQARLAADAVRVPLTAEAERDNRYGASETVELSLDGGETAALLRGGALRASAEEMLLAAALGALRDWLDADALTVTMEGHGRDDEELDLSGTVGWFTALYPLTLTGLAEASPQRLLRQTKQALRAVPAGGAGYGALRQADDADARALAAAPEPQIAFNYLGQFDASLPADGALAPAPESVGAMEDPDGLRPRLIDIVALVSDGKLSLRWNYGRATLPRATVEALARQMRQRLLALLSLDADADAATAALTPDDFPLAALDEAGLPAALGQRGDIVDLWSLTPVQEGMLFHSRMEAAAGPAGVYIEQIVAELDGAADPALLRQAWQQVLARHDALRVSFAWEGLAAPLQRVHRAPELPFTVSETPDQDALERYLAADRAAGFDLNAPPLMRLALLTRNGAPWRLVWTHHHALLDGWSMAVVFDEALALYRGLSQGRNAALPLAPSFGRFIKWLRAHSDRQAQQAFWRDYFNGYAAAADLALLPAGGPARPRAHALRLDAELSAALRRTARERKVTLNTLFQGALAVALSRIGRCDDLVFGVTMSGRPESLPARDAAVGLFIATLPLRADCSAAQPVDDFLRRLQDAQSQLVPFESSALVDIQRWSGLPARQPLFDAVLVYENYPIRAAVGDAAQALRVGAASAREQSNYPLTLYVKPGADGIELDGVFDAGRIEPERVAALLEALPRLLRQIADGAARVGDLRLAEPDAPAAFPPPERGDNVLAMLASAARLNPDKTAVAAEDGELSYRQLVAGARALARRLAAHGVAPGDTVALALPPDGRALTALLATLWAGAQYLPLDPALPPLRRDAILEDARPGLILVDGDQAGWPASARLLTLPAPLPPTEADADDSPLPGDALHPEAPAYTLFTSGSTGRPKGVQIAHRSLANILRHFSAEPGLGADDVLLSVTTWSFDIAALELLLPLVCGGTVAIAPAAAGGDGPALAAEAARRGASVIQATPVSWRMLLEAGWKPAPGLRAWCGGEALPADLARALLDAGVTLWNVYGPTETTIWSALHRVDGDELPPPAGHAVRRTTLWVADHHGQPLPPQLAGELHIGGDGLALGYLGAPAQTAARFRPDPLAGRPGARVYRSGDLACLRPDGKIRVLGRLDGQAKLNGFRLELEEVETRLRELPGVRQAAAAVRLDPQGHARLIAYLVPDDSGAWRAGDEADPAALQRIRARLSAALPGYMLPSRFVALERLPLTANLKLDRKALPEPAASAPSRAGSAPQGALEQAVCALWEEVFERAGIAADDDFFELGGHSLLATRIQVRVNKIFRQTLPLRATFHAQTPRALAALLAERESAPGLAAKIAAVYLKLRGMSDAERDALRQAAAQPTPMETAE
ncbi:amino acid adenylation domain-containing protein [Chromobacterium alkanivorans]|uniref:jagaricin-like haemolysin non-ribosomal peptide synthetase HmlC n=1 Tax=Chromobacterium alkanivorans TaxID=1071719 RepID=UPI00196795CF|nr:non-ribosomal peptide synthetase [Chromobacterium alkanivorans]MBN3006473.1 amino acid adenylation domain-containing protein [Chromobacterium alkanivorans]